MLENRVYIVTGGATGIGAGITAVLRSYGAQVEIFQPETCDVRDPVQVDLETAKVLDRCGRLDGLVNNAGLTGPIALAPFLTVDPAKIEDILATNLKGPIYCSQSFARRAVERGQPGAIVHIASVGAFAAQENASIYCASKAALVALTQAMALELAHHQIRVNAVAPGDILTPANAQIAPSRYPRSTPAGRRGTPREIGEAVAFLLSDNSSFTTGATLTVDGGLLTY
ncbi:MAG: SDR family oxidoreductase [Acidobacteria bacterium]|nr:SDR family oxidoreductase [Acidobacteriota bacterium]